MAYIYSADEAIGEQMCKDEKHHWHMTKADDVVCCRCSVTQHYNEQVSEGPHDDKGDA